LIEAAGGSASITPVPAKCRVLLIPDSLMMNVAPHKDFTPNPWNPNKMDGFMRGKLHTQLLNRGFVVPIVVRPNKAFVIDTSKPRYEIIDGEHRWTVSGEEFDVSGGIPVVDVGDRATHKPRR
jgi:hypothetical protein